jgi:putative tricarboxylic transport membrane protein
VKDTEPRRPGELLFALATVVFSVAAFWQSMLISGLEGPSEPGVFPSLASATMVVASLLVLRTTLPRRPAPEPAGMRGRLAAIVPPRLVVLAAFVVLYIAAMPALGFMASSALFLFAAFWLLWHRGPLAAAVLTAVSLAAIWLVFREVFQVLLPRGTLLTSLI